MYGGVVSDPRVFWCCFAADILFFSFSSFRILWTKMFHVYVCMCMRMDGDVVWLKCVFV